MNNEPVAWMHKTYFSNDLYEEDLVWSKVDENSIPLYTHPVDLTDNEIFSEMLELLIRYRNETPLGNQPHMIAHVADDVIARAILRKAQEK